MLHGPGVILRYLSQRNWHLCKQGMRQEVKALALNAKGFLSEAEGLVLFELAAKSSRRAPCLEIGSYCGRSALFLAEGCRIGGRHPLFSIDHHRGSEEQQPGQPYFDEEVYDTQAQSFTTLEHFMRNIRQAGLYDWVIPIAGESVRLSHYISGLELSLVFIDGSHSAEAALADFTGWSPHIISGGYLCVHDIFSNPAEGGQGPYNMFEHARSMQVWDYVTRVESLGVLRHR